jgi:hypothetical protein
MDRRDPVERSESWKRSLKWGNTDPKEMSTIPNSNMPRLAAAKTKLLL